MTGNDTTTLRERLRTWERATPELEALRHEEIRRGDQSGIRAVIPTADLMRRLGVGLSSETGLVEQQAWFARLRHG
ncbi:MAG: hypothetical protein FJ399_13125 [Verrucomicrobia bacterium]|nr:hypothetical protein [Verrucomicrobiota bacterium]